MSPESPALAGTHTRCQGRVPAVENANELGANRLAGTAELERQVADQAAEQEFARLVFIGECMEEASDALLSQSVRVKDRQQPHFDVGPVVIEDRGRESLFARKVSVEGAFRHTGRIGDVLDATGGEAARVYEFESRRKQAAAHIEVWRPGHADDISRPVAYLRLCLV